MPDDPVSLLSPIRERGYRNGATGALCARLSDAAAVDIPVLLAAVEAALKLTEPTSEVHRDLDGNEEGGVVRVVRCDVLRSAITSALSGTQPDEDEKP